MQHSEGGCSLALVLLILFAGTRFSRYCDVRDDDDGHCRCVIVVSHERVHL